MMKLTLVCVHSRGKVIHTHIFVPKNIQAEKD